jgi:hypothetical protein
MKIYDKFTKFIESCTSPGFLGFKLKNILRECQIFSPEVGANGSL